MLERIPYDRRAAVAYAHQWAYGRNPDFYDYEEIGGDCTNFASQCLYAGTGVMNFDPVYGWFYRDPKGSAAAQGTTALGEEPTSLASPKALPCWTGSFRRV